MVSQPAPRSQDSFTCQASWQGSCPKRNWQCLKHSRLSLLPLGAGPAVAGLDRQTGQDAFGPATPGRQRNPPRCGQEILRPIRPRQGVAAQALAATVPRRERPHRGKIRAAPLDRNSQIWIITYILRFDSLLFQETAMSTVSENPTPTCPPTAPDACAAPLGPAAPRARKSGRRGPRSPPCCPRSTLRNDYDLHAPFPTGDSLRGGSGGR